MGNSNKSDDMKKMDAKQNVTEEIRQYILNNLLSVIWSASIFVGGLIFWLYFLQIQYFPDLSSDEALLLLPLAAITGLFFLLLMVFILMLPYFMRWVMIGPNKLRHTVIDKQKESVKFRELLWFFSSMFLVHFAILIYFYLKSKLIIPDRSLSFPFVIMGAFILCGHLWFYSPWFRKIIKFFKSLTYEKIKICLEKLKNKLNNYLILNQNVGKESKPEKNEANEIIILGAWIVSCILSLALIYILIVLTEKIESEDPDEYLLSLILLIAVIFLTNFCYAVFRELDESKWWHGLIPFITVLSLIYVTHDPLIPRMVMKRFQFGNFIAERLILDKEGCQLLRNMALKPKPVEDENTQDLKECYLENIKILSRIGTAFVLEKEIDCKKFNLSIPKEHVLSWRIIKEEAEGESGKDIDSDSVQAKTNIEKTTDTCSKDN